MLVRDVSPEVFDKIKDPSEFLVSYSYVKKSAIDPKYYDKHFFKVEFIGWETNENNAYCRIVEDLGPLFDEANYRKIIMLN